MTEYELEKYSNSTPEEIDNWYDFGNIYMSEDKLYYENGKVIPKKGFKHKKNGIFKAYLANKKLLLVITFQDNKKNGVTKCYFSETDEISWIDYFTNDKLDGVCQKFNADGILEKEETFVNGVKEGVERRYYKSGQVEEEIMYKGNVKNGFAKQYYENGQISHEVHFINDKQEGVSRKYYESGKLKLEDNWKNDKPHGKHIGYHENGQIASITELKNGHYITEERQYYDDGSLKMLIPQGKNGMDEGETIIYHKNGNVKKIMPYHRDKLNGCVKEYSKDGILLYEYNYKKDKKHGICKDFYKNGKLQMLYEYNNDKINGRVQRYYRNGNLCYEYNYKNGLRHGVSISYDLKTGEIATKTYFYKGKLNDIYTNEGIVGVKDICQYKDEDGTHMVKSRKLTREEKKDWDSKYLIFFYVTDTVRTKATLLLYNTKLQKTPIIIEKVKDGTVKKDLSYAAQHSYFIVENDDVAENLYKCKVQKIIPDELFEDVRSILKDIIELKNGYNINKGIITKDKILIPNNNSGLNSKVENTQAENISETKSNIEDFKLDLINCSRDIEFLTDKIIKSKNLNFSICIYGDPGTGKSAYARYLADKLGLKVISKSAADLLDQYVGNGEQKIQEAFEEAAKNKSMLIIDEVDSFLRSRGFAQRNWEVTMVNQMLTCMEHFNYPFVCTTNFIDTLDQASLRRFTFKLKFGFLKKEKIEYAFEYIFKTKPNNKILNMNGLTVSDFVTVKKECDILDIKDIDSIAKMLDEIVSLKESEDLKSNMGFN